MSELDYEKQWQERALTTTWYGQKMDELDHDQLITMIGYLLEDIDEKEEVIDKLLDLMEEFVKSERLD